jgi:hypothetical protein
VLLVQVFMLWIVVSMVVALSLGMVIGRGRRIAAHYRGFGVRQA